MLMQVYCKERKTFRATSNFEIKQCFFLLAYDFFCYHVSVGYEENLGSAHNESFLPLP